MGMSNDQIERLADAVADRLSSSPVAAQQLLSFELTEVFHVGHGAELGVRAVRVFRLRGG